MWWRERRTRHRHNVVTGRNEIEHYHIDHTGHNSLFKAQINLFPEAMLQPGNWAFPFSFQVRTTRLYVSALLMKFSSL